MPSLRHEALIELVRQRPRLAVGLVQLVRAFPLPAEVTAALGSEDMSAVAPPTGDPTARPLKLTADGVVTVTDPMTGKPVLLVIVEPQGEAADEKEFSWPCYLANARLAGKCRAATLVVLCWDQAEADKCRLPIATGHSGFTLIPWVIDRRDTPDLDVADPYLVLCFAILGAVDLGTDAGTARVVQAISASGAKRPDHRTLTRIMLGLASKTSSAARQRMEEQLMTFTFERDFIDDMVDEASGRARQQGHQQGIERGQAEAKAADILKVLDARGLKPAEAQAGMVSASTDLAQLDAWFDRALTATSADDVFKD